MLGDRSFCWPSDTLFENMRRRSSRSWRRGKEVLSVNRSYTSVENRRQDRIETFVSSEPLCEFQGSRYGSGGDSRQLEAMGAYVDRG